eukprot:CAMPEP_0201579652 /NCGR_PEP_ID=MMETSP0190_2-20130828/27385_1 /ASSEMBLY_ACC=CAM_ASM_000263 /TAXON_ID=37353 /ORGANISM="Rosalina sp." /LENGTH=139 /DNA_ID=CAMNT_0048014387 /DNA_START=187 /DNA_END=606 /DNA_ORIENTATION=+
MQVRYREGLFAKLERPEKEINHSNNNKLERKRSGVVDVNEDADTPYSLDGVEHGVLSDGDINENKTNSNGNTNGYEYDYEHDTKRGKKGKTKNGTILKFSKLKKNSSFSALSTALTPRLTPSNKILEINDESDEEDDGL